MLVYICISLLSQCCADALVGFGQKNHLITLWFGLKYLLWSLQTMPGSVAINTTRHGPTSGKEISSFDATYTAENDQQSLLKHPDLVTRNTTGDVLTCPYKYPLMSLLRHKHQVYQLHFWCTGQVINMYCECDMEDSGQTWYAASDTFRLQQMSGRLGSMKQIMFSVTTSFSCLFSQFEFKSLCKFTLFIKKHQRLSFDHLLTDIITISKKTFQSAVNWTVLLSKASLKTSVWFFMKFSHISPTSHFLIEWYNPPPPTDFHSDCCPTFAFSISVNGKSISGLNGKFERTGMKVFK